MRGIDVLAIACAMEVAESSVGGVVGRRSSPRRNGDEIHHCASTCREEGEAWNSKLKTSLRRAP